METRQFGKSGLRVSALGLGGNNFGWWADEKASDAVIRTALDQGINFFDTANIYGMGSSEEWLGKALKSVRNRVHIATKFGYPIGPGANEKGGSRFHLIQAVEKSLRRLGTDYIDLYQMHFPDPSTPVEETLRALDDMVTQGKVRYIGCSNFAAWQLTEALAESRLLNLNPFISVQSPYNLLNRQIEQELVPCCKRFGIGLITYTPLAGGFLSGKYKKGRGPSKDTRFAKVPVWGSFIMNERNFTTLSKLEAFASGRGHKVAELAFAWLLSRSAVTTVIAGATKPEQVLANAKAVKWKLEDDEAAEVDRITQAHIGLGDGDEKTSKALCPWCGHQTPVRFSGDAVMTDVRRVEPWPEPDKDVPLSRQQMCNSCLGSFVMGPSIL